MFPWILIGNLLNRSPFLTPKKRPIELEENQGEMGYERSPVKAPPNTTWAEMITQMRGADFFELILNCNLMRFFF